MTSIYVKTTGNAFVSENTPIKTVVTTVFYVGSVFFKNKYPVVLTRIYVKTTGNVFALENTPIKNDCINSF